MRTVQRTQAGWELRVLCRLQFLALVVCCHCVQCPEKTTASLGFLVVDPASPPALTLREFQRASPIGQDGTGEGSYTVCGQWLEG